MFLYAYRSLISCLLTMTEKESRKDFSQLNCNLLFHPLHYCHSRISSDYSIVLEREFLTLLGHHSRNLIVSLSLISLVSLTMDDVHSWRFPYYWSSVSFPKLIFPGWWEDSKVGYSDWFSSFTYTQISFGHSILLSPSVTYESDTRCFTCFALNKHHK